MRPVALASGPAPWGVKADPEWAERIRATVQHLPNKWPEVDRADVGVAVRDESEARRGGVRGFPADGDGYR